MKAKYANKAQLLFTDTDSLMYAVETEDIYADMVANKDLFDMSNFEPTNPYYQAEFQLNKAAVGLMKDEAGGYAIYDWIGLRAKMYSFLIAKAGANGECEFVEKHRAKGIQRAAAETYTHAHYTEQLHHPEENYVITRRLGSRLHKIYGIEVFLPNIHFSQIFYKIFLDQDFFFKTQAVFLFVFDFF